MAPDRFDALPLRAQKRARTRIALVEALVERLATRKLEEISAEELAAAVHVSTATFFNHFPSKGDLLTHFIQLWSLRVGALARAVEAEHDSALAAVEALLVSTAEQTAAHPRVMLEVIAHQARMPADLRLEPVDLAERLLFLPGLDDVASLSDGGLGSILPDLLARAVERGELPAGTDTLTLGLAVASVFFGVPLVLGARQPDAIAPTYRRQLALLWAGARASEKR